MEIAQLPAPPTKLLSGSETVLLVEDEDSVRKLARQILEASGYTVLEASRPEEALMILAGHHEQVDIMVTDVVMPQMSGSDLAEELANRYPETKVLYMSGYNDKAVVSHEMLTGQVPFLQKPFTPDDLRRKVREVLNAKGQRQSSRN